MKTLKSNKGSFGVPELNVNGTVIRAVDAGFTNADSITKTSVYAVSGDSSSSAHLSNLPSGTGWGFLYTYTYNTQGSLQVFVSVGGDFAKEGAINVRKKTASGSFLNWYTLPAMTKIGD